jgi:hypothetical protein
MGILDRWDRHNQEVMDRERSKGSAQWLQKLDAHNQKLVDRASKPDAVPSARNWWPLLPLLLFLPLENGLYFLVIGVVVVAIVIRWARRRQLRLGKYQRPPRARSVPRPHHRAGRPSVRAGPGKVPGGRPRGGRAGE